MRTIRWILLLVVIGAIYYGAVHTRDISDAVVAEAPKRLGIDQKDWNHWSHLSDQIRNGHMPDLNDKDWAALKKMWDSTDASVHEHAIDVLKLLDKTQYKDRADEVKGGQ